MIIKQLSLESLWTPEEPLDPSIVLLSSADFYEKLELFKQVLIFGYDLETFSQKGDIYKKKKLVKDKDALNPFEGKPRLIQVAISQEVVFVIDLGGLNPRPTDDCVVYADRLADFLAVLAERLSDKQVVVVGHNIKFDLVFTMQHLGFHARNIMDTMLMSQILWSGVGVEKAGKGANRKDRCKLPHTLKAVAQRLGLPDVDKTEQKSDWSWDLSNRQLNYAAIDAKILLQMVALLKTKLEAQGLTYAYQSENLACPVYADMEYLGFALDRDRLESALQKYYAAMESELTSWKTSFPTLNWSANSADIVAALNSKYPELQLGEANADVLSPLKKDYPEIASLLSARTLNISIQYLERLKQQAFTNYAGKYNPYSIVPYTVRSKFRQIASGWRSTSGDAGDSGAPNLQNSPKLRKEHEKLGLPPIRSVFAVPQEYKLVVADMAAAHAKIATKMSQDSKLTEIANNNMDLHIVTTQEILKAEGKIYKLEDLLRLYKEYEAEVKAGLTPTDEKKHIAKSRDYGKIGFYSYLNQAGGYTLQTTFASWGIVVDLDYCYTLIKALRRVYKGLYKFVLKAVAEANSYDIDISKFNYLDFSGKKLTGHYGVVRGLTGGRNLCLKIKNKEGKLEVPFTDTISFMWLSSEANIIKTAMGKIREEFLDNPHWEAALVNMAHDEVEAMCKKEYATEVAYTVGICIRRELERFIDSIPVEKPGLDYKSFICQDWHEGK